MSTHIRSGGIPERKRGVRTPVQARSRATVDAILEATAQVLASRGYAKTTTNHIVEAAGLSIGSFYQYFADKDDVIAACAARFAEESLAFSWDHLDDSRGQGSKVHAWLIALVERAAEHESLIRVLFEEVPYTWTVPGVRDAMAGALEVLEELGSFGPTGVDQRRDRSFVMLKSVVSVVLEIATNPALSSRRTQVTRELALMVDAYLACPFPPGQGR